MPKAVWAPLLHPDERLDSYRRAVGTLRGDDGQTVGRLALRADVIYRTRGRLWRGRHEDPREILDFFIVFEEDHALAHPDGWNDGLICEEQLDSALAELAQNTFRYRGELLHVDWLVGDAAEDLLQDLDW